MYSNIELYDRKQAEACPTMSYIILVMMQFSKVQILDVMHAFTYIVHLKQL